MGAPVRNVREIYIKLREVKHFHLVKLYKKFLKKIPSNCKYNYPYKFSIDNKDVEIRLCLLHQPSLDLKSGITPHLIDLCQEPVHCINCNAFLFKHTKESIKKDFEEELKDQKIKTEKYPDVCALEWVLEYVPEDAPVQIGPIDKLYSLLRYMQWLPNKKLY